ncbi:MAG: hypothetical protein AAB434_00470 [Planctomycetota bacterium]
MDLLKHAINAATQPYWFFLASIVAFFLMLRFYRVWTKPRNAAIVLAVAIAALAFSLTDTKFRELALLADNIPIMGMLFLVGFCVWLALRQAAVNDERIEKGLPPLEKLETNEKVLVWPDLVYTELIAMVVGSVILIVWSLLVQAPLEQPANPTKTPNPSKAPWYFLGLQELLVYFDPWIAGVVLPTLIIVGLIAIPYMDRNPKGQGYYTLKERPFAISVFLFGFIILWVLLVFLGTFLRGPNWNIFGPYEEWDPHKVVPLLNVNVSELFWRDLFHTSLPSFWLIRELPGIFLVVSFFAVLPPILARTVFRKLYVSMGFMRYNVMANLLLVMVGVLLKMFLRWTINLKYIVAIPEFFFNI